MRAPFGRQARVPATAKGRDQRIECLGCKIKIKCHPYIARESQELDPHGDLFRCSRYLGCLICRRLSSAQGVFEVTVRRIVGSAFATESRLKCKAFCLEKEIRM